MRELAVLIPLGIIGAIRWSVWLIRRVPAVLYRPIDSGNREKLTVVTPVYQEDPEIFRRAIASWKANRVEEIIAVIDETDVRCKEIAEDEGLTVIMTDVPGKRDALRLGWEQANTPIIALVDSDTLWADDVADRVSEPFADPEVGGVGTRQNVYNPDSIWERLNDSYLDYRYFDEIAGQSHVGQAVSCLSGRTAVYRREVLLENSEDFMGEQFWGVPCNSGEDKRLTMLTLRNGHKTYMQQSARVWSTFPKDGKTFFRQRLRWARNTWRSDLRTMFSRWAWTHKWLMFTMIDKALAAFTLLIPPIFFIYGLITLNWLLMGVLAAWWLVSRTAKNLPHIVRRPSAIFMMPVIIVMSFALAVVKIIALLTIRTQRWLTRDVAVIDGEIQRTGNSGGAAPAGGLAMSRVGTWMKRLLSRISPRWVGVVVVVVAIGASASVAAARQADGSSACLLPDDVKDERADEDPLYNGTSDKRDLAPYVPRRIIQSDCAWSDDIQVIVLNGSSAHLQRGGQLLRTVGGLGGVVQFERLAARIDDPEWIDETAPGVFELHATLFQLAGTELEIRAPGVTELRLVDKPYVFLGGESARALADGITVTSWSTETTGADLVYRDGRPYVLYLDGSRFDINNSEFLNLGSDRSGAYGVSWRKAGATGDVVDSVFANSYFGVYTFEASDMLFRGNTFRDNVFYGADPHDRSIGLHFEDNEAFGNGSHGIIVSRSVDQSVLRNNRVFDNRGNGVVLDFDSTGNVVEGNTIEANGGDGIVLLDSAANQVIGNTVRGHEVGIRVNGERSDENFIAENLLTGNNVAISAYGGAERLTLERNEIRNSRDIGIVLDAPSSVMSGDTITGARTGIEIRSGAILRDVSVSDVTTGVAVKDTSGVGATIESSRIEADDIGVRVDRRSNAELTGNTAIEASKPIKGSKEVVSGDNVSIKTDGPPTPRILGLAGLAFIILAVVLEIVRRSRGGHSGQFIGNAPPSVASI